MAWPKGVSNPRKITDQQFISDFPKIGIAGISQKYGITERKAAERRRNIEERHGLALVPPSKGGHVQQLDNHSAAVHIDIQDGHILIGSDSHYWPGIVTTAHRAFLEFAKEFKPKVIIKNGDDKRFAFASRRLPGSWTSGSGMGRAETFGLRLR